MKKLITLTSVALFYISGYGQIINFPDAGTYPDINASSNTFDIVNTNTYWAVETINGVDYFRRTFSWSINQTGALSFNLPDLNANQGYSHKTIIPPGADFYSIYGQHNFDFSTGSFDTYDTPGQLCQTVGACGSGTFYNKSQFPGINTGWYNSLNKNTPNDHYEEIQKVDYIYHLKYTDPTFYGGGQTPWHLVNTTYLLYVRDTALYNNWVRAGKPLPDVCDNATAGTIESAKTINVGYGSEIINSISSAQGGVGNINYLWQYNKENDLNCTKDTCWTNDSTNANVNYTVPLGLPTGTYYARRLAYTDCGYTITNVVTLTVGNTTGLENNNFLSKIKVYPNPTSTGLLSVEGENIQEIKVYNVLGENIYTKNQTNKSTVVDLTTQPQGVYFVNVKSNNSWAVKKIIIQ